MQAATSLVKAHRTHGHLAARLDPLGSEPVGDPALEPATVGLTPEIMEQIPAHILRIQVPGATLAEALPHLRETYCGTIAYEIEHIADHQQRVWLRNRIESGKYRRTLSPEEKKRVLSRLTDAEALETYLHRAFIGAKSFSIEGIDSLIPMLDESFGLAADAGVRDVFMGMAHRGRLNVLAHAVGRPYSAILAEFEGEKDIDVVTARPRGGTGDVKYHQGATGRYRTDEGKEIEVTLASNPSHLEYVDPVVEGRARARQTERDKPAAEHFPRRALSLLIHGDAAFPGEGVVAETINLEGLDGYSTGGVLHLIANNQIGFTTEPHEARSTRYASDLAKGFDIPIIHVNADDPEACIAAVRLAMAYREEWRRGAVIDLIGYRRFGHNEADEPAYTQPKMYALIKQHPPVRKLYADTLVAQGIVPADEPDRMLAAAKERLAEAHEHIKHQDGPAHRRAAARPHPERGAGHQVPAGGAAVGEQAAVQRSRGLQRASEARPAARQARRGGPGRPGRLGPGGGARVRHAADAGAAAAPHRPGQRARHLQPAPPRAGRREDRQALRAGPAPRGRGRLVRDPQQPAVRGGGRSASSTATACRHPKRWSCGRPSSATS